MNAMQIVKLTVMGVAIAFAGHWLKGHDGMTAVVLMVSLFLIAMTFIHHFRGRRHAPGSNGDDGTVACGCPVPVAPLRPTLREASAVNLPDME